jgi:lipopolysaccharide biosynthesis glycosyltransferase
VFSTDDRYCQHLSVAIASLVANNRAHDFQAHIIHHGISEENLEKLTAYIEGIENFSAVFHEFDAEPYKHFRLDGHISLASYFRLFLTEMLPRDVNKVLYLDADIVVLGDVSPIWNGDLGASLIGATMDPYLNSRSATMESNLRINLPLDHVYFNAGILVINLEGWRNEDVISKFVTFIEKNHQNLLFHDQDALNSVLSGRVNYFDYEWNFQAITKISDAPSLSLSEEDLRKVAKSPKIVHFTTVRKPWFYKYEISFEREYFKYLRLTPWASYVPPDRTLRMMVGRRLKPVRWLYRRLVPATLQRRLA